VNPEKKERKKKRKEKMHACMGDLSDRSSGSEEGREGKERKERYCARPHHPPQWIHRSLNTGRLRIPSRPPWFLANEGAREAHGV